MSISQHEALCCVKLLVCVAKADGELATAEHQSLQEALADLSLPSGITALSLLGGTYDADSLLKEIKSPDARDAAYSACFTMAHADGVYHAKEQELLARMEKAWEVSSEKKGLFGRIFQEAKDTVSFTSIKPIADPGKRESAINEDVMKYAILAATLGLNPVPVVKIATEIAVIGVQGKMVRDIGQYHGQETTKQGVKQLLVGMGAGQAGRVAINSLLGFVPVLGSAIPAITNFASTWAVGRVANQYYAAGGKLDAKVLRDSFKSQQKEGKKAYEANKSAVEAKAAANKAALDKLGAEYKAGTLTQAEYEQKVLDLK